jgi:predicted site-specific integrase-resolvase
MEQYSGSSSLKAKDVMSILGISRQTLSTYVKQGLVKVDSTINGKYRYNKDSVLALLK